jgi:hypothetical protein
MLSRRANVCAKTFAKITFYIHHRKYKKTLHSPKKVKSTFQIKKNNVLFDFVKIFAYRNENFFRDT